MANTCDTSYKVIGSPKVVKKLWNTLQEMEVNSKNIYLYELAERYGIDYKKKGISVRGFIYWAEFEEKESDDYCLLSFDTETAWSACDLFFDELNKALGGELSISYREIEPGCDIYFVHDECGWFPEECCVSSSGEPFEESCGDVFSTVKDAINEWCTKMNIEQGERTDAEMLEYISEYDYDDLDTYFYINEFTFG
jgi:hypothetical protein